MSAPPGKIDLTGLCHRFSRHGPTILSEINLTVDGGQALALVGRSGCGKSTLLHIIAGLLHPTAGSVHISGQPVGKPSAKWNMMFQSPSLFPWMSAAENIALGLRYAHRPKPEIRERVEELLALVHLSEHGEDNVQQLSGGQQQRVALARSLATRPEVLLLDEPFSALDPFTRSGLQEEVRAIAAQLGLTLVIVTHDVDEALIMAERAVVMAPKPGRVVADIALTCTDRAALRAQVLEPFEAAQPLPAHSAPDTAPARHFLSLFPLPAFKS
ncbi:ABC transporter ATP-binding protein [Paramagnetospirillum marisnigri]|uniref:ABC transporter ATP-binding protein n=1 Tax=Paramagnetospirillum marisnigri TaxID=1285242 RepID=UPI000838BB41|nr:ABC transporter ATP-binding protein [Paramagnetospirillum marisnigri]